MTNRSLIVPSICLTMIQFLLMHAQKVLSPQLSFTKYMSCDETQGIIVLHTSSARRQTELIGPLTSHVVADRDTEQFVCQQERQLSDH